MQGIVQATLYVPLHCYEGWALLQPVDLLGRPLRAGTGLLHVHPQSQVPGAGGKPVRQRLLRMGPYLQAREGGGQGGEDFGGRGEQDLSIHPASKEDQHVGQPSRSAHRDQGQDPRQVHRALAAVPVQRRACPHPRFRCGLLDYAAHVRILSWLSEDGALAALVR